MFGRPSFGTQPTSFGFGTSVPSSTSFGQSNQLFGNTSGGFGTTTTGFGAPAQPMFGSGQPSSTPLFGTNTNTSSFGQPNQAGFGSTLFGNAAQPSSSGIFGTASSTTFGQQNKPTGFGFNSSAGTGGLFSQSSQQTPQNASVFQTSSTGGIFGTTNTFGQNTNQMGTVVKFTPVTGTDSIQKSGLVQSINTKHYCITCMKDYENKSLEELRFEDYQCNRKGPQQQSGFGAAQPFGVAASTSSIFGQPDNKPTFGQTRTDFGTQNAFGMGTQTTTQNAFAKPATGFGTTSTNSFGFGTNTSSTGLFGSNTPAKPFATPTTQLFQQPQQQQQTGFASVFGQTNTQNTGGMFGKPNTNTGFNTPNTGFSFPQQNQSNLFQTSKPNTGFGVFGQTTTQTNTFGQQQTQPAFGGFGSTFKPAQPTFGTNTAPAFGNQQSTLFGNQNKSVFGNTSGGSLFNNNTFQQNTSFQFPTQQQQQQQQQQPTSLQSLDSISQDLRSLVQITDPYGYNKHLEGLSPIKPSNAAYVTNPKDLQKLLESPPPMAVVSPMNKRLKVLPISAKKTNLFDEMLDKETNEINFSLRTSAKRLVIGKELKLRSEAENDITPPPELNISVDTPQRIHSAGTHSAPVVSKINLSSSSSSTPLRESSSEPILVGHKDSLTSLININSNLSKGDSSEIVENKYPDELPTTPRERGDDPTAEIQKIDTCGVVLTRPEYYTVPPLEKLIEHKNGDGKCLVKGFTIGRVGYGNVCFPDLMDVTNLNLDELVHFRYREVTVYPDDTKKPPVGQGLNRRAQVTLDRVFPKAKTDRKLITDAETLMAINFSDTLRDLCEKHSTKFLDYRPETGSWVFMVEHFSKYGFSDSDDEESAAQFAQKQKLLEQKVKDEYERRMLEEQKRKREQKLEMERKFLAEELFGENELQKGDYMTRNGHVLGMDKDLDLLLDEEMAIEENSLGTLGASIETIDYDYDSIPPAHEIHHIQSRKSLYQSGSDMLLLMKSQMYDGGQKFEPVQIKSVKLPPLSPRTLKDLPNRAPLPPAKRHTCHPVKAKAKKFKIHNFAYTINIDQSLYKNRNYMDVATFKGRSFKVGWGRGMQLITKISPKLSKHVQLMEVSSQSTISALALVDASPFYDFEPFKDRLEKHLQVVLDTADVVVQQTNVPFLKPRPGKTALLRHQLMARETARDNIGSEQVNYYQQIWDLCAACWGPMSKPTNRRDLLSTWLEKAVEQTVEEEFVEIDEDDDEVYKKIFTYMTGHHITEAANLAADEELHNLSLLISQLNASQNCKGIMQQQLDQWQNSMVYNHVRPIIQKLYMLTSGKTIAPGSETEPIINVCQELDWMRCFAIMLWYIAPSTDTIARGLELYRENFEDDGYATKPTPQYNNRQDVYDLQYHLMLLHVGRGKPLESVLHPETHAKKPTDFRLSWLLLQTLQALDVGIISSAAKTVLTTSFAQQLENIGLYKWAVFVLLFLEDPVLRKKYILGVLHRNLPPGEDDRMIEDELVTEFCLPAEWLHEVKAYKTTFLCMPWESYKHFSFMEEWVISHDIAITDVIPQLLVNEEFDLVSYILRDLEPGSRSIITWPEEGGLILMFLDMYDKFQEKRKFSKEEAMSIHSLLLKICTGITNYPFRTVMQRAAIAEISKHCTIYSRVLLDQMQLIRKGNTLTTNAQLEGLTMPPDYRIDDMNTEMNDFYEEQQPCPI